MNLANKITILRILLIPFFIAFFLYGKWQMALFVFIFAALTDGLDGYIARRTRQITELGKILDPIADKLLILSAFICLSVAKGLPLSLKPPYYVPVVIISREAIIALGVFLIYLMKGELRFKPSLVSKVTTFFQMITVIGILLNFPLSPALWNITVLLTVISGVSYVIEGSRLLNGK